MYIKMVNRDKGVTFDLQNGIVEYKALGGLLVQSRLGKKDRDVLIYLINNVGRLISKDEILHSVWTNRIVCDNTVSVSLSNIRKFLRKADEDCSCLTNVSGSGYIFNPAKSGFRLEKQLKVNEFAV
ncbi:MULTISPECIES: winged helix-turn-helix domain-containing protein [Aeromonas]|uniref:winged helix-turn-helix domain-containing protein n=1 Tax=Aeromonas TaxID=642 RepID=UPI001C2298B1|nr:MULTISPECIES: winged helix-turn-helix domain-containing protein [Aeromonas]MCX4045749.1 winged helix-turn-helix domain-containing protein [Aeromonas veronii]QWZ82391.1 winged helix-turn-helix domain-containing protein [Aeromonas sp. FDAARGOS 1414]UDN24749.1 winged helix-turn-helix domain-containing protein [Aeromonas veronii]HDN9005303.1 winged helix-turn-helix domain-containing protein [Aeromonas veronii]